MTVGWLPGLPLAFDDDTVSRWATWIVLSVATVLAVYACGDPELRLGRRRFWSLYVAFVGSAIAFAHASGIFTSYVTWEAMSVCSFGLIAQRLDREAVAASVRALTTTRLGDLMLLVATGAIMAGAGTVGVGLALVGGAIKSGQLGAAPWLVGAMVAPTPVSALLHAATLVAAGPYLVARLAPQLSSIPNITALFAVYVVVSAFAGALLAASSTDAKRTLAWSTSEQMAQTMLASAVGLPSAAFGLLAGHALAKPLLFMAAGDLRAATGSTEFNAASRRARGVKAMVAVAIVGALGLAGIPPFLSSGALAAVWSGAAPAYPAAILMGAALSALAGWYVTRFVVRLFPDDDRPFRFPTSRAALNVAAWLGIVLLTLVSIVAFRLRLDVISLILPAAALAAAASAFAARRSTAIRFGPAFADGVARWDRVFSAATVPLAVALDRFDRILLRGGDAAARTTIALGSGAAVFDDALDRNTAAIGRDMREAGRTAARPVDGNVSRYVAYTAGSLIVAAAIAIALIAVMRGIA